MLGGMAVAAACNFLTRVLLGRYLGPADLGMFAICFSTMFIAATAVDLGIRFSMVNLASRAAVNCAHTSHTLLWSGLSVKLATALCAAALGWLLAPRLAADWLRRPELSYLLQITSLGIAVWSLWDGVEGGLHIQQRFAVSGTLRAAFETARVASIFLLLSFSLLRIEAFVWFFMLLPLPAILLGILVLVGRGGWSVPTGSTMRTLIRFSPGVLFYRFCTMLVYYLDTLMLARYVGMSEVGLYEAARSLAFVLLLASESLGMVTLPKFNRLTSPSQMHSALRRLASSIGIVLAASTLWAFLAGHLLVTFGKEFATPKVLTTFLFLIGSAFFTIPNTTVSMILFSFHRPGWPGAIAVGQLVAALVCYPIVCPRYGIEGAAALSAALQMLAVTPMIALLWRESRRRTRDTAPVDVEKE